MGLRNVLIFTYYWPPASAGGVWRFLKMSKYLPEFGWNPIIVTVEAESGAFTAVDATLVKEVPEGIEVHRTKSLDPYRIYNALQGKDGKMLPEAMSGAVESQSLFQKLSFWIRCNLFIPDPKRGWARYATRKGRVLLKGDRKIDAIVTTGPPNSVHLIGTRLKKEFGIYWVMDMRDPWSSNYMVTELMDRSTWADRIDLKLETKALVQADVVTGISDGLLEEYADRARKMVTVYNGFDHLDFKDLGERKPSDEFILSYIGSLKPNQDITACWKAIAACNGRIEGFEAKFRLRFIGNLNPAIAANIREYLPEHQLIQVPFVPHAEATEAMRQTSCLLFIVPRASYAKNITSGKVFEYMASRSPMLSLGPVGGDADRVLDIAQRDPIIDYDDIEGIAASIAKKFEDWQRNDGLLEEDKGQEYERFSRKYLAREFVRVLDGARPTS